MAVVPPRRSRTRANARALFLHFLFLSSMSDTQDRLKAALADRYEIQREDDFFGMTLHGSDLTFHKHTFGPAEGAGLVAGDVAISPRVGPGFRVL